MKHNNQEYTLTTSQFAKLCQTTRDTLRHYDDIGLLVPAKDPNNGYHYYSSSQLASYYFIDSLKQTGCSLEEIGYVMEMEEVDYLSFMKTRLGVLEEQIRTLQNTLFSTKTTYRLLEHYQDVGKEDPEIFIMDNMSICYTPIEDKNNAKSISGIGKDFKKHALFMKNTFNANVYPSGASISLEDIKNRNYVYNNVVTLVEMPADNINAFPLPSNKVVSCFHSKGDTPISESYNKLYNFIVENKLKPLSDLISISLINLRDSKLRHNYLKYLFICIDK